VRSASIFGAVKNLSLVRGSFLAVSLMGVAACGGSSASSATPADGGAALPAPYVSPPLPAPPNLDKTPIDLSMMPATTWSWVPVDGAICRDGSPTGIGINLNPASKDLVIYLEGGGACFNTLTCGTNPKCFDPPGSTSCGGTLAFSTRLAGAAGSDGLFNRTDAANPVKDWNYVYVPFCTGDVHAGNHPNATVPGVAGMQQFVGYVNMQRYLARLAPTFKNAAKVLLTGISAGGFGSAANYLQTAKAFAPTPVYSLDDSGPPMADPPLAKCLQKEWVDLWGFEKTILAECGPACPDHTNYSLDATVNVVRQFPHIPFGLVEDTGDSVITLFYGYGQNSCASSLLPTSLTASQFTAGLLDERKRLEAEGITNAAGFVFQGTTHTSLGGSATYDSVTATAPDGGAKVKLSDWVTTLVNDGTVTNVGP
jgi:hypothetical protein